MLCKHPLSLGILSLFLSFFVHNSSSSPLEKNQSTSIGKFPLCGDNLETFDQRCCEQAQELMEEDSQQWEKRGFDISRQISLSWKSKPKSGSGFQTSSKSECMVIQDEVRFASQPLCFQRSARSCCRKDLNPKGLSRCRLVEKRKADGSILMECQKAIITEHEGRFGIVRTVQPRCGL